MKPTRLLILVLLFPCLVCAQRDLRYGDRAYDSQEYSAAIGFYHKAVSTTKSKTDQAHCFYQLGQCYQHLSNWEDAKVFYVKAKNAGIIDDHVYLHLAEVEQEHGDYNDALADYTEYKKRVPSDPAADIGIKACNDALSNVNETNRWKISNESQINTKYNDFCPTWSDKKHTSIIFSSKRTGQSGSKIDPVSGTQYSDLFEAKIGKNGKWSTPSTVQGDVNLPEANDGASCITKNGNHIFFTRCDQKKNEQLTCKIYYAEKQGNAWGSPVMIDFGLDAATLDSFNFRHPAVSVNEDVMVFSSDYSGTTGGEHSDLWISTFDAKTKTWSKPENLGSQINTNGREGFPYLADDGTLYFSSDGHGGLGGLDIYSAKKDPDSWKWYSPENMKTPFNSPADDFGIVFDGKKKKGFLTSNREGSKGADDIWMFYYEECSSALSGMVSDSIYHIPVHNAWVTLYGSDGTEYGVRTDANGNYKFQLKENVSYLINVFGDSANSTKAQRYFSLPEKEKGKLTTMGMTDCKDFIFDFEIQPIEEHDIVFPAVLYGLDSATLRPQSKDSLNYLYQLLIDNPSLVIEIDAHTDCRGSAEHNRDLSQRRAQACVDYLISKGIDQKRLQAKGWGEDHPLKFSNGVVLTEKYIDSKKTVQEREALHQLNRRTVFRVISNDYVDPKAPKRPAPQPVNVRKGSFDESGDEVPDNNGNGD
ncbi:MAG: OmpA family protein [Bacteroidetes bacterium]|nr:OmpA family protein [Bacteroidota bacterium]